VSHNGHYGNPVSVLYRDTIEYEITAVNANLQPGDVVVIDTLPPYMELVAGSYANDASTETVFGTPTRDAIQWEIQGLSSLGSQKVRYRATPEPGAVASQPLFVNYAWVQSNGTPFVRTNGTYHQGAGISLVTFSAAAGGSIFSADRQALDYRTSPREGVLVVPDSGYVFAGWRHDAYVSLRGEPIPADSGILHLDSLTIYGNVELRAEFVPAGDVPGEEDIVATEVETGDKVWAHDRTLYVHTLKGSRVCVYTLDGVLRHQFVTTANGITTRRPFDPGIYIVTLNSGRGYKVLIK
jgi:uncharacterized repeat protein (TIGR01451 family)